MRAASLLAGLFTASSAAAAYTPWCSLTPQSGWLVCDPTQPLDTRAADIVSRLSLADKFTALSSNYARLPSANLPSYNWWSEATHGINGITGNPSVHTQTNTALPITTSCAFNRTLWRATGNQIGREARAYANMNATQGQTYWAPVVNIVRDPRWGRNLETPGEDPFVAGEYAVNFVQGFQRAREDPYLLQASACCKHFVANELEATNGTDRYSFNAIVSQQDLVDSYLPPFQACVEEGEVSGVMCSYNAVNGVPSCANSWLLKDLLRGTWAFDGYVTADCDADDNVFNNHHYTRTPQEAVAAIVAAGQDVDCNYVQANSFMTRNAPSALSNGNIKEADLDTLLQRQFRLRIRLGTFEPTVGPLQRIGPDQICSLAAIELARDGARQGAVLLKNDGNTLPLALSAFKTAVVIGPNGHLNDTTGYYGSYTPCNYSSARPFDAVQQRIPATTFVAGVPSVSSSDTSGVAAAAAAAATADLVILALGSDLMLEQEARDRTTITLSAGQLALVSAVAAAAKGPVVAILFSGGAVDVTPLLANARIHAVVHAGQPSVQVVGTLDVVFGADPSGKQVSAAGRMSQTIYGGAFVNEVSMFDFGMRPGPSVWPPGTTPGRTHRFYSGPNRVLPFGYGLSFTNWTYTPLNASTAPVDLALTRDALVAARGDVTGHTPASLKATAADFWVNVTNTGTRDSDDVVLGFIVPPGAGQNGVALQELFGFERVHVPAGGTVTVYLGAQARFFTRVLPEGSRLALPGAYSVLFGVQETAAHGMGFAKLDVFAA